MSKIMSLAAALLVAAAAVPPAAAQDARPAAFFGLTFLDAGDNASREADLARTRMIEARLRDRLAASGRYTFVDTAPVAARAARYANLAHCNGCDAVFAQELGAALAVTGEVQKTSNLILHFTVYIRDAATGALVGGGSTDIRGNTDETWTRGMDYLLRNRLLVN